jgi:hypothetical protein
LFQPPLSAKPTFLIHRDHLQKPLLRSPSKTSSTSATSFHQLPPVPSTSVLQLPAFLDYSFHSTPSPQAVSQTLPVRGSRSRRPSVAFVPPALVSGTEIYNEQSYSIPAFQHPNSPYVPWTTPTRHKILRPLSSGSETTMASSSNSQSYSRSGAMAPEPGRTEKWHGIRRWHIISRTFKQNVNQVKKRISSLAKPFKVDKLAVETPLVPSSESVRDEALSPALHSPCLRSPCSITSGMSTESNSLAEWLTERQREVMERDKGYASLSLEEYEKMGSWINLTKEPSWSCGVPDCEVHSRRVSMLPSTGITMEYANKQAEDLVVGPFPSHTSSQFRSAPTLPSMMSN